MILNFDSEIAELAKVLEKHGVILVGDTIGIEIALVFAAAFDKGMAFERKRCLDIIARKALNASDLRAEINRPVR